MNITNSISELFDSSDDENNNITITSETIGPKIPLIDTSDSENENNSETEIETETSQSINKDYSTIEYTNENPTETIKEEEIEEDVEELIKQIPKDEYESILKDKDNLDILLNSKSKYRARGVQANIVRIGPISGAYYFPPDIYMTFLSLIINMWIDLINYPQLYKIFEKKFKYYPYSYILNLYETKCNIKPLLVDIDIDYIGELKEGERIYKPIIKDVIDNINEIIKENFEVDDIMLYLLEKECATNRNKDYKDGVHIQVNIPFNPQQRQFIYNELVRKSKEQNILKKLPIQPLNPIDGRTGIFDPTVINDNAWPLYGATKILDSNNDIANPKRKLNAKIFNKINEKWEEKEIYFCPEYVLTETYKNGVKVKNPPREDLIEILTIRQFEINNIPNVKVKPGKENINETPLQSNSSNKPIISIVNKKVIKRENEFSNVRLTEQDRININDSREYLKMLSYRRCEEYDSWMKVCFSLKNVSELLFDDFIEFSKQCPSKYNYNACVKQWNEGKFGYGTCNIGTLRFMAKQDNPNAYEEYLNKNIKIIKNAVLSQNIDNISNMLIPRLTNFITSILTSGGKKTILWYIFVNNRWNLCENPINDLREILINCAEQIEKVGHYELSLIKNNRDKQLNDLDNIEILDKQKDISTLKDKIIRNSEQQLNKGFQPYKKLSDRLKNIYSETDGIIVACANKISYRNNYNGRFVDKNNRIIKENINCFESLLDSSETLIGFANGVYDIVNRCFREGYPNDYISASTRYNYKELPPEHPKIQEVLNYFSSIQPNKEVRDYLIDVFADCLFGKNTRQKFYIIYGGGRNGKSALFDLMNTSFGDYFTTIDKSLITNKNKSVSVASPELLTLKGKRIAVINELDVEDRLRIALIKQLSGKTDEITARYLHSNNIIRFINKSRMFLITNNKPFIETDDEGTRRRFEIIPFDGVFVDELPNEEEIKEKQNFGIYYSKIDYNIEYKMLDEEFNQALMNILIQRYIKIQNEGVFHVPKIILDATSKFLNDNNYYALFIDENFNKNPTGKISMKDMNVYFNQFVKDNGCGDKVNNAGLLSHFERNGFHIRCDANSKSKQKYVFGLELIKDEVDENETSETSQTSQTN